MVERAIKPEDLEIPMDAPAFRIAFSTAYSNRISIYDSQSKAGCGIIDGPKLGQPTTGEWTYIDELGSTNYLVSLNVSPGKQANFEILDLAKGLKVIYSHGTILEKVCTGGFVCNKRRDIIGILPIKDVHTCQIFDTNVMEITKRIAWQPHHKDYIQGISFDYDGDNLASIGWDGSFVVSKVDSGIASFELNMPQERNSNWSNRCRWNTSDPASPLIAVKFADKWLNFVDAEKQRLALKVSYKQDPRGYNWLDWNPCDPNLLALGGIEGRAKIYDCRKGKIVKRLDLHYDTIRSIRWNHSGDLLATACQDNTAKVADMRMEKEIHVSKSPDNCNKQLHL